MAWHLQRRLWADRVAAPPGARVPSWEIGMSGSSRRGLRRGSLAWGLGLLFGVAAGAASLYLIVAIPGRGLDTAPAVSAGGR